MARGRARTAVLAALAVVVVGLTVPSAAEAGVSAPSGLSPDDGPDGPLRKNLELSWFEVPGARGYDVQMSDDDSFTGTVLAASTTITHWAPPTQLARGSYVWRVRAKASEGVGPWSSPAEFTRGWDRAQAPSNATLVSSAGSSGYQGGVLSVPAGELPAFTWDPVLGASFYEVEISNQPFLAGYPPYTGTDDENRITCYTQHTWFVPYGVAAGKSDAPGDEGSCTPVLTGEAPPADGTVGGKFFSGVTYYWRVRGRDGTLDQRTTPFSDPALSCTGVWGTSGGRPVPTPTPTPGAPGPAPAPAPGVVVEIPSSPPKYLAKPECSQWAQGRPFVATARAAADIASVPTGLSVQPTAGDPLATTVTISGTPLLRWSRVDGTLFYRIYVSRTTDFTDSDAVYETHATSLSPAHSYADRSVRTYWTVQACGLQSCSTAAPAHAFIKQGWNGVRPLDDGSSGLETILTWSTQWTTTRPGSSPVPLEDQATAYQVQVDTLEGGFAKPLVDATVDQFGDDPGTATLRLPSSSLPERFVWRVRALDETGAGWGWRYSAAWGRVVSASGFGVGSPITVRFTGPVTVPAGGIKVLDSGGRAVPGWFERLNDVDWAFTPSGSWTAGEYYHLQLQGVTDAQGATARAVPGTVRASTTLDTGARAVSKVAGDGAWTTGTASQAYGHSYIKVGDDPRTSKKASISGSVSGRSVTLVACRTPSSGRVKVYIDGRYTATVDLYRSYSGCGTVLTRTVSAGMHRVTVVHAGSKHARSKGYWVHLDAIRTN